MDSISLYVIQVIMAITKEKLEELKQRVINHEIDQNHWAFVRVSAGELQDLIELAEKQLHEQNNG